MFYELYIQLVLNQLLENSKMLDNRLAEEDFPVTPGVASAGPPGLTQETEELPLLDIPFMLTSFLLSQVTPVPPVPSSH